MAQWYNLKSYKETDGTWSNSYGTFKTYWVEFEGIEGGVMLNKKEGSAPSLGAIYGDLVQATSQKGNTYWKFKTQKKPDGEEAPEYETAPQPTQSTPADTSTIPEWARPLANQVNAIEKKLEAIHTLLKVSEPDVVGDLFTDDEPVEGELPPEEMKK
jgi:hypothetical protein